MASRQGIRQVSCNWDKTRLRRNSPCTVMERFCRLWIRDVESLNETPEKLISHIFWFTWWSKLRIFDTDTNVYATWGKNMSKFINSEWLHTYSVTVLGRGLTFSWHWREDVAFNSIRARNTIKMTMHVNRDEKCIFIWSKFRSESRMICGRATRSFISHLSSSYFSHPNRFFRFHSALLRQVALLRSRIGCNVTRYHQIPLSPFFAE